MAPFLRRADAMLEEKEFFIRKAIGWVLRDTARRRPELVAAWLAPRGHRASGGTVREAVKPLPPGPRDRPLGGYRGQRPARAGRYAAAGTGSSPGPRAGAPRKPPSPPAAGSTRPNT